MTIRLIELYLKAQGEHEKTRVIIIGGQSLQECEGCVEIVSLTVVLKPCWTFLDCHDELHWNMCPECFRFKFPELFLASGDRF